MIKQIVKYDRQKWINVLWHLFIGFLSSWVMFAAMYMFFNVKVSVFLGLFITTVCSLWLMAYQMIHYVLIPKEYEYILFEFLDWPQYIVGGLTILFMLLI